MNPHSATREQFTVHLTSLPCPEDAHKDYKHLFVSLQKLLDLLAHHEAMRPNLQQTFMTSAASKNKIYFMYVAKLMMHSSVMLLMDILTFSPQVGLCRAHSGHAHPAQPKVAQ